ncbi:amyloid fiber anchoring/assembly protein TapA [Neobacillus sp. OS1-2]|uniref:amyloid fiber anchoring/assembly protein TapA n=1 Tax=Neobacillus sp. OS1-2 TaxID=3070680 RepID=UPI0027DF096F|nr:amyloid fiber anchoring/assembly protein TapA [Neobacillus sp. OS1-2]WML40253.1 amyloid fiber anchoring/assembly protein TapA [Neobacillus sp. OS1-2]
MIQIRNSRLKKFGQKNKRAVFFLKILAIWYFSILSIGYLTTDTGAYFSDNAAVTGKIQAGTWEDQWDKSSLKFSTGKDQLFEICDPKEIAVTIINSGSDMKGPSQFEVYYINNGNPMKGEKVGEGTIEPIKSNQSSILKFTATKPGNYKFRAFQRPNHAFKPERQDLWSETVTIACKTNSTNAVEPQQNQTNNQEPATETTPPENINPNNNETIKPVDPTSSQNNINSTPKEEITNQTGEDVSINQNEDKTSQSTENVQN